MSITNAILQARLAKVRAPIGVTRTADQTSLTINREQATALHDVLSDAAMNGKYLNEADRELIDRLQIILTASI